MKSSSSPPAPGHRVVALIPARRGSRRVTGKNVRELGGHPLLAYTIAAAVDSGVFESILVSTDDAGYAAIARHYGAETPFLRPAAFSGDKSPDIDWVEHALNWLAEQDRGPDAFSILRPTSPFRKAATIRRAWEEFRSERKIDSLRAVERCSQHPNKMWRVENRRLIPLLPSPDPKVPSHSLPMAALPEIYVQNASLEIAWARVVAEGRTISGAHILPFFTSEEEGFDINTPADWLLAETLLGQGRYHLPTVERKPFATKETADAA